jgi:L-alanine-DL-glutamate epimerase-like enolase superfamily enzyme
MESVVSAVRPLPVVHASNPSSVVIRRIEAIPVRIPFSSSFTIAAPHSPKRESVDVLVVRIHTNEGVIGVGETQAWRRQGSAEVLENQIHSIRTLFAPVVVGKSPFDVAAILGELNAIAYDSLYVQAAIGDALYDLMGKLLGVPVHMLLGGKCRERIAVGYVLSISSSPEAMIDEAQRAYERGYRHQRIKIGIDPKRDVEHVRAMRKHFGDKVVLRADANGGMSYDQALSLLRKLEEYDLDIVEQPIAGWDLAGMAALARTIRIPLSADESLITDHSLIKIAEQRAASVIQTKTGKNGGIHYCRALWQIAHAAGISIFPGNHPGTSVQTAAVAHLCAAWPHELLVGDFQVFATDMISEDVVVRPAVTKDGYLEVPTGPGLGFEIDEDRLKHVRLDR